MEEAHNNSFEAERELEMKSQSPDRRLVTSVMSPWSSSRESQCPHHSLFDEGSAEMKRAAAAADVSLPTIARCYQRECGHSSLGVYRLGESKYNVEG